MMNFMSSFMLGGAFVWIILIAFWVWMLVDCAQRKFRKDWEKLAWILVIVFAAWFGAFVYFIVIRMFNPKGILIK